MMLVLF